MKSIFEENLKQKFKSSKSSNLNNEQKKELRLKTLEDIFTELTNKNNRYLFYCPDIVIINDLAKIIYDTALKASKLGYEVVILHELNGFKCKWLYELNEEYKNLKVDYIIKQKSKKSKKTKQQYSFKPSDTIIIPDVFQEIFDNIYEAKLIQKVLLVTSHLGIGALQPGFNHVQLGIKGFLFLEKSLQDDYNYIFGELPISKVLKYDIDLELFSPDKRNNKEVYPVITISNLGNVKFAQQVVNTFYNLYPFLNVFSFKIINRENYEEYVESLKRSCLFLNLDDQLNTNKTILEAINLGIPVATFNRRELNNNEDLKELAIEIQAFNKELFEVVEFLGKFCSFWLFTSNTFFESEQKQLKANLNLDIWNKETTKNVEEIFSSLQEERVKFFASIQKTINNEQ